MSYFLTFLSWINLILYFNLVPPINNLAIGLFFLILFTGFLSTVGLVIHRSKFRLLFSLLPTVLVLFFYYHQLNLVNAVIIIALTIAIYIFIR